MEDFIYGIAGLVMFASIIYTYVKFFKTWKTLSPLEQVSLIISAFTILVIVGDWYTLI